MYKKLLGEVVGRTIEKHFKQTSYKVKLEIADDGMIDFVCKTSSVKDDYSFHTYKGYVGSVGQIVIQQIDNSRLNDYITLN